MLFSARILLAAAAMFLACAATSFLAAEALSADSLLRQIGDQDNLCVILGLPDADRAPVVVELARGSKWRVYFQSPDEAEVAAVRQAAEEAGLLGERVFAQHGKLDRIPLADNLAGAARVSPGHADKAVRRELLRVLHPTGKAVIGEEEIEKPYPAGIEPWDHPYHGPDNNPQSYDEIARAPYLTQFIAGPKFSPMPEQTVAAGGVVFKAFGHIAHKKNQNQVLNTLVGINAYNGTILWQRPNEGYMIHRNTMVAMPGMLLLGDHESLKFIDAKTGETRHEIVVPDGISDGPVWKWMGMHDGVLHALVGGSEVRIDTQRSDNRGMGHWPWGMWQGHDYKDAKKNFGFGRTFIAIDIGKREIIAHHREQDYIDSRGVCMKDGLIYYYSPEKFVACLDPRAGKVLWRNADAELIGAIGKDGKAQLYKTGYSTSAFVKATSEHLVFAGPQRPNLVVARTEDGKVLWQRPDGNLQVVLRQDSFYAASREGIGAQMAYEDGRVLAKLPNRRACTRATGSIDSIFYRTPGGTVRFDTESRRSQHIAPMRPPCQDGVMISNGLLYWGPWMCGCQLSLYGHVALGPAGEMPAAEASPRLEHTTPADTELAEVKMRFGDWHAHCGDHERSQATPIKAPEKVRREWSFQPVAAAMPSAPVAVGGLAFHADRRGVVRAIDREGKLLWKAYTGGPVYYPPAFNSGRLFVGSADGRVHAFEAASGRLLWRYRVAPGERMIPVFGELISTWPVAAGVIAGTDRVYAAAGITHYDGTYVVALDTATGELCWENTGSGSLSDQAGSGISLQGELWSMNGELCFAGGGAYQVARFDFGTGRCMNKPHDELNSSFPTAFYPYYPEYAEYTMLDHRFADHRTLRYVSSYEGSWHTPLELLEPLGESQQGKGKLLPQPSDPRIGMQPPRSPRKVLWQKQGLRFNAFIRTPEVLLAAGQAGPVGDGDKTSFLAAIRIADGVEVWKEELPCAAVKDGLALDHDGRIYVSLRNGELRCLAPVGTTSEASSGGVPGEGPAAAMEWTAENRVKHTYPLTAQRMLAELGGINEGLCIDIGCGPGQLDVELAKRSKFQIIGLDIDPEARPIFEKRIREAGLRDRVSFVNGDAQALPFPDNHADAIVSRGTLALIPDIGKCLQEVSRVLKPAGVAFLGGRYLHTPKNRKISNEKLAAIVRESGIPGAEVIEHRGQWVKITGPEAPKAAHGFQGGPHMLVNRVIADYRITTGRALLVCGRHSDSQQAMLQGFLDATELKITALYSSEDEGLKAAKRVQDERITSAVGGLGSLPFDDDAFDLVIGTGPMLIFEKDRVRAMREIHRVLRKGGAALIGGRFLQMPEFRKVHSDDLRGEAARTGIQTIRVIDTEGQWVELRKGPAPR